jgi:hypothetical protein
MGGAVHMIMRSGMVIAIDDDHHGHDHGHGQDHARSARTAH